MEMYSVMREKSSATCATRGRIQVLNCCAGRSCASCSVHACHRAWPASALEGRALCEESSSVMGVVFLVDRRNVKGWKL